MNPLRRFLQQLERMPQDHRTRRLAALLKRDLVYWATRHHRRNRPQTARVEGLELLVLPGVFNPGWFYSTPVLMRLLKGLPVAPGSRVLELCTGSGAASIVLGQRGFEVVAVDINPAAVHCARLNVQRHGLKDRVTVLEGDLYGPVAGRRFDLIVANPPFLDGVPRTPLERAFLGGPQGEVVDRLIREAPEYLEPGGRMVVSYSSLAERGRIERLAAAAGLELEAVLRSDLMFEVVEHYLLLMPKER